ncbi:MAG: RDD family protein [Proteobacteria bacterium]|nr:RDD family protein [Pseudomonadota bacterium]
MKINTAEQIALEFKPVGYGGRAIAYIIDFCIIWTILIAVWFTLFFISRFFMSYDALVKSFQNFSSSVFLFVLAFVPYFSAWVYSVNYEVGHQGVTPGKRIMGLRVIDKNGFPLTYKASIIRRIFVAIDMLPFCGMVAFLSINLTEKRQRLGDLVAGTLVVYEDEVFENKDKVISTQNYVGPSILIKSEHYALLANYMHRRKTLSNNSKNQLENRLAEVLRQNIELNDLEESNLSLSNNEKFLEWVFERAKPELENVSK